MHELGPFIPQGKAAEPDEEIWFVELSELDCVIGIGDQERITGLRAIGREHELHVAELQGFGLDALGLAHSFALRSQGIEI